MRGRVLISAAVDNCRDGDVFEFLRPVNVGKALAQIDGTKLRGKRRHLTKDRRCVRAHSGNQT